MTPRQAQRRIQNRNQNLAAARNRRRKKPLQKNRRRSKAIRPRSLFCGLHLGGVKLAGTLFLFRRVFDCAKKILAGARFAFADLMAQLGHSFLIIAEPRASAFDSSLRA
jgi:hypothetical protein